MRKSFQIDGIEIFVDPRQDLIIEPFRGIFVHKTHAKCRKELDLVVAYKYIEEEGYAILREVLSSGNLEDVLDEYFNILRVADVKRVISNIDKLPSDFRRSVLSYFANKINDLPADMGTGLRMHFVSFFKSFSNPSSLGVPTD